MVRWPPCLVWLNSLMRCSMSSVALSIFCWWSLSSVRSSSGVAGTDFEKPRFGPWAQPLDETRTMADDRSAMHTPHPATGADLLESMVPPLNQDIQLNGRVTLERS